MADKVILYGHATCPKVPPTRGLLAQSNVEYEYIDIRKDLQAAATVRAINNGYESVPTLVFPDGSTLTEPSVSELKTRLESLGYRVGPMALILANFWIIPVVLLVLLAILRLLGVF